MLPTCFAAYLLCCLLVVLSTCCAVYLLCCLLGLVSIPNHKICRAAISIVSMMEEHQHIYYSFSLKPSKEKSPYGLRICEDEVTVDHENTSIKQNHQVHIKESLWQNTVCTYVYNHKNPTPASSAIVNCRMITVNSYTELDRIDRIETIFTQRDLDCVSGAAQLSISKINSGNNNE